MSLHGRKAKMPKPKSDAQPKLSDDAVRHYIEGGGARCPFCESEQIEGGPVEIDYGRAFQEMGCIDCDKTWNDVYALTGIAY
jgi:hypothetical protein